MSVEASGDLSMAGVGGAVGAVGRRLRCRARYAYRPGRHRRINPRIYFFRCRRGEIQSRRPGAPVISRLRGRRPGPGSQTDVGVATSMWTGSLVHVSLGRGAAGAVILPGWPTGRPGIPPRRRPKATVIQNRRSSSARALSAMPAVTMATLGPPYGDGFDEIYPRRCRDSYLRSPRGRWCGI